MITAVKIPIGISSCLMGEKVRYDGQHQRHALLIDVLEDFLDFNPFCPEMAIGLGVPRETIRLIVSDNDTRCVKSQHPDQDLTQALADCFYQQPTLFGYIFKRGSPSCGIAHVKRYNNGHMSRDGTGIFAKQFIEHTPSLPIIEESQLNSPKQCLEFLEAVRRYHALTNAN